MTSIKMEYYSGSFQFFTWFEALNILYHRKDNKFSRLCATTVIGSADHILEVNWDICSIRSLLCHEKLKWKT